MKLPIIPTSPGNGTNQMDNLIAKTFNRAVITSKNLGLNARHLVVRST